MANELEKVGLVFTEEGAVDFKKTLQDINSELNKNYNQFRITQSQWDSSTSSTEKLRASQEYLSNAYQIQQDKVNTLRMQLEELENSENKNTTAINKKRNELTKAEIKLQDYNSRLKEVDAKLNDSNQKLQQYGKKISDVSEKISDVGNKASVISAGVVAGGTILANNAMNLENAVAKYVSSTNTAENETEKYKQVLENINKNNYGEGYEDIADSMAQVTMQLKDLNEQDLQNITEKAIALRDLFGYDVSESIRAVKAMMDNLNVSADEAFNLIAEGKKQGLDFSNELLDNINEYSVQFGKLGLSAQDMFNIFKVGADNGAFNLDKIGDAVKEFSIRAIDGSNTTIDGFKRIGLNADTMAKKFASGGETAKQAFIEVVNRLGKMDDKVSQSIAGVDLFGTMWEDLGPTVITSFSKMDNGISKSSDSMQKSIDQLYNTTKKKAETQLKRLQSLGADFGEEMLPVLEDLIDAAEGFIDKLDGMSDAEKENIVKIGLFVAGVGPLIKTMGTAGQVIGGVTQGIGTFTQAIGVATGKTTSSTESVNNLANIFGKLSNPINLTSIAIGSLIATYTAHHIAVTQEKASLEGLREEVENQSQSWKSLAETRNETLSGNLAEIENTSELADELKKITEENGKVKEGYEDRAQVILNQLNSALGTEYSLNGNIIAQYQELKNNIDQIIEKKKAEAVLNAYQQEYEIAVKKETEATKTLVGLKQQLADAAEQMATGNAKERKEAQILYSSIAQQIGEQTEIIGQYGKTIQDYENLQTASVSGNAQQIQDATQSIMTSYEEVKQASQQTIEEQINTQTEYMNVLKNTLEEAERTNNQYQANILNSQLETEKQKLTNLVNSLVEQTSTIQELTPEQINAWKKIADSSYTEYSKGLMRLPEEVRNRIQESTGVIALDTTMPDAAENKANVITDAFGRNLTIAEKARENINDASNTFNRDTTVQTEAENLADRAQTAVESNNSRIWGEDMVEGLGKGIESKGNSNWFTSKLNNLASKIASFLHFSRPDTGPLREYEKWMPDMVEGLGKTLEKSSPKLIKKVKNMSEEMANELKNIDYENQKRNVELGTKENIEDFDNKNINNKKNIIVYKNYFYNPSFPITCKEFTEEEMKKVFNYVNKNLGKLF